jgi:hypothetical protein
MSETLKKLSSAQQQIPELQTELKRKNTLHLNFILDLRRLIAGEEIINDFPEIAALRQQILERDAAIAQLKIYSSAGIITMVGFPEPSEALRQYTEKIKKEVQEKCAVLCQERARSMRRYINSANPRTSEHITISRNPYCKHQSK